ncbi:MAG TPA: hypothetical protein QF644_02970 [Candidatus Poseidoniaceae archaeon]|nr:hypothetical protein [Candidatus Poseidoniaceae archaeon]
MKRFNPIISDTNAANSAIATVLMFAGVMSIISVMLVSIVPVINELQGAIESNDAVAQFEDLSEYEAQLAQRGLPGSSSEMNIEPVLGKLEWDLKDTGVWFSSSWNDDSEFRLRNAGNFNNEFDIRYPSGKLSSYCMDDLHLQFESKWRYELPAIQGKIIMATKSQISSGITSSLVTISQGDETLTSKINNNNILEIDLPLKNSDSKSTIISDVELTILLTLGEGGATFITPNNPDHQGFGTIWKIPLPAGNNNINLISEEGSMITWELDDEKIIESSTKIGDGSIWSKSFNNLESKMLTIESSNNAKLLLDMESESNIGSLNWPSTEGLMLGNEFLIPPLKGTLIISNHENSPTQIDIQGSGFSINSNGMYKLDWPIAGTNGVTKLSSNSEIAIKWTKDDSENNGFLSTGISYVVAKDTGQLSGQKFSTIWTGEYIENNEATIYTTLTGSKTSFNFSGVFNATGTLESSIGNSYSLSTQISGELNSTVTSGHSMRIMQLIGTSGITELIDKGTQRCLPMSLFASGWIKIQLPWYDVSELTLSGIRDAWENGEHHSGIRVQLIGETDASSFSALADAWVIQVPALKYKFSSSISNLEVVNKGGIVTTNHPEGKPSISHSALAAKGNSNLLGVHLPVMMPTKSSVVSGSSDVKIQLKVIDTTFCTNEKAKDVRMGWNDKYGGSITNWLSEDLEYSDDWISYPNQFDMLSDYTGWVDRNDGEAVYHSPNNNIDFTLTFTSISFDAKEEGG